MSDKVYQFTRQDHEKLWTAVSKLESQVARNPDLPPVYQQIVADAFEVLRKLDAQEVKGDGQGISRITAERRRQLDAEGWTPEHDDEHGLGEMALAAIAYASPFPVRVYGPMMLPGHFFSTDVWRDPWPWDEEWDKRKKHPRIRQLEIAGALIAAEIDRLLRADPQASPDAQAIKRVLGGTPDAQWNVKAVPDAEKPVLVDAFPEGASPGAGPRCSDEQIARVVYERAFDASWDDTKGAERELWLEVGRKVHGVLFPASPQLGAPPIGSPETEVYSDWGHPPTSGDESAWLIERGGLCLGTCEYKLRWVTFTDPNAIRFSRQADAYALMEVLKWAPFKLFDEMQDAFPSGHTWVKRAEGAAGPEPAIALPSTEIEPDFCVCDYRPRRKCSVHPEAAEPESEEENHAKFVEADKAAIAAETKAAEARRDAYKECAEAIAKIVDTVHINHHNKEYCNGFLIGRKQLRNEIKQAIEGGSK